MSQIKKIVCPKCKAKLKFDPDKITSEVVKFKCPGCKTVLRLRRSSLAQEPADNNASDSMQAKIGTDMGDEAGSELKDLAKQFEEEMGFTGKGLEEVPGEMGPQEAGAGEKMAAVQAGPEETADDASRSGDARKYKRVKFKKKVLVNNQIMVDTLDISENGIFLHTGRSFEDGAVVEVGIPTMPGNFDLKVQAKVMHNHRGIGMGLQFVEVDDKQRTQLKELISELDEAAAKEHEGKKKILLVGGTDTARNIIKSKLVLDGFYVLQATTPEEVFRILQNEPPDAMVMKWQEPNFNCRGLLARIKENTRYDSIIMLVLSELTDATVQREILDAGADRYMAKMDTNPAKLSLILKEMIAEREG